MLDSCGRSVKRKDLHKLCSTSHILAKGTHSHSLRRLHHGVMISHPSYSLTLHASWLFYLRWSENHPQRREISNSTSIIKINILSLRFITFMVIYKKSFLHYKIYSLTFFCWQGILFLSFGMFQLLCIKVFNSSKQILFFLLLFYSWKQSNNFTITHLVSSPSCFKYHSGLKHEYNFVHER